RLGATCARPGPAAHEHAASRAEVPKAWSGPILPAVARMRRQEGMPVVLVAALFAGAAVLNLGAGFVATAVVRSGFDGDFHLPTVGGGSMEIALVEPELEAEKLLEPDD